MSKIIFPTKSYLIFIGENPAIEAQFRRISDRVGFRLLKVNSKDELDDVTSRVKKLFAVVNCSNLKTEFPLAWHDKYFAIPKKDDVAVAHAWLVNRITAQIPVQLAQLMENAIAAICPRLFEAAIGELKRSYDFELSFTNLIACDSSAEGFSAKTLCEANFAGLRKTYPSLKSKTDAQLTDVLSEICNQVLGVVNCGLRPLGLDPMITLPIGIELSTSGKIAQVDFMPMIRLTDPGRNFAIAVAAQIEPNCAVKWEDLTTGATDGDLEFFVAR